MCLFYGLSIDFLKKPSAARHAKFELEIFKNVKIEEQIVIRKVSTEIHIYCYNLLQSDKQIPILI